MTVFLSCPDVAEVQLLPFRCYQFGYFGMFKSLVLLIEPEASSLL